MKLNGKVISYGYGLGSLGLGAVYYFMSAYFVVFLTNSVGLSSTVATTIASIALAVEVITGMIIGNYSDKCTSKHGKRRPFMFVSGIAMLPVVFLMLNTIDASMPVKVIYYLFFAVMFRVFFSNYEIPYNAMGAEIAADYDDRTRLRTIVRVFSIAGNAIGYILPLVILDYFVDAEMGWRTIGIVLALCAFGTGVTSVLLTREPHYDVVVENKRNVFKDIVINYKELLAIKPMKYLIVYKAAFSCAFALSNVATLYFLQYNLGLDNMYSSYIYTYTIIIFVVVTPIVDKVAIAKGKAWQQMVTMAACGVAGIVIFVLAFDSVVACAIYIGLFAIVQSGFWQLSSSIFYDIVEVDEFVNHKRREGDVNSLVSVLGTFITAAMVQCFGILFDIAGFDPQLSVQPESVSVFLGFAYILIPCICLLVGAAALKVFPINKYTFASLQKAIELRCKGEDYSEYMDDINKILK